MQVVEFKGLVDRLNPQCRDALENAAGTCVNRLQYEITIEHMLAKLLDNTRGDIQLIAKQLEIDPGRLARALEHVIEEFKTGNNGRPQFSSLLPELFADAWLIASVELFETSIRSGALMAAFVARSSIYASGAYTSLLKDLDKNKVMDALAVIAGNSDENAHAMSGSAGVANSQPGASTGNTAIARFCEDFTAKARDGKIDPVFGRDAEIRQMVDILARRRKNNPICVGDPGVGKTAVVEGLALRVIEGDVPEVLSGVTILGLDMGALEAGAGVKGEFENRLRGVINEIKASTTPILLFIDEAHTLIGAGGSAGTNDAANLLKPALARGELRTIAATTWSEYKKYFEKDPALARRFELVKLDEPSVEMSVQILRGLKDKYEDVHRVIIRDDALHAAAELSDKYITGRQLPDKAIDLLDTACARIKVNLSSKPDFIEDCERELQMLAREKRGLLRDQDNRIVIDGKRLVEIDEQTSKLENNLKEMHEKFEAQLSAAKQVLELRKNLIAAKAEVNDETTQTVAETERLLGDAEKQFEALQSTEKLVFIDVSPDTIAKVVSDRTGVPLGKMMRDQAASALTMESSLEARIKGQDEAMQAIAQVMKSARSGLRDPDQPMGIFLLVGPSGTGKTETALAIADIMFGGEHSLTSINMSEFQEKHTVSRLVGSPPGYVGYGEGGVLTEAVRQRPYSTILLDEVEKAHLDVVNLFYQVFDKGVLSDGEGREINFRNTVIFLTSNLGLDVITELCQNDEAPDVATITAAIRPILSNHFKPALLARMTIIPFVTLSKPVLREIVELKVKKIAQRMLHNNKITLEITPSAIDTITARCTEVETGARNIDFILKGTVLPLLSNRLLASMTGDTEITQAKLDASEDGQFTTHFS